MIGLKIFIKLCYPEHKSPNTPQIPPKSIVSAKYYCIITKRNKIVIQEIFASAQRAVRGEATPEDTMLLLRHSPLANQIIRNLKNPTASTELTLKEKLRLRGLPV
jgi:hypothetical protein